MDKNNAQPKQKAIKFHLILKNKQIRSLEELINNFEIESILHYYE